MRACVIFSRPHFSKQRTQTKQELLFSAEQQQMLPGTKQVIVYLSPLTAQHWGDIRSFRQRAYTVATWVIKG